MPDKVVLRYRDGRTERVALGSIDPTRQVVDVVFDGGEETDVPFADLKAIFYPRVLTEDAIEPASGMHLAVEFSDGEVIRGFAEYNPERNGFFLYPLDRSKNDRIFVVSSAIASIEVEKL